ncbi:MAG: DoxX family membrane protein [Flavobacteriaceae bacterium]|jgi:uncharacterized membrane protein YphA (DoxX/SURF4 family)|nr:DoxX family membrane protein [Flavobacteriaceae bacterium]
MKYITYFFRIVVGVIFIISGGVKTVDPIGFSYKLEEYFGPGVFDIPFLQELALPIAIFFVVLEVLLGVFLLLGIWKRFTVYSVLLLIIFFAFLTFYSAYFNKVTDCGCFGEALKLAPWTSFWKDIALLVLILFLVFGIKYTEPLFMPKVNLTLTGLIFIGCFWVVYQGIAHLPLIDFRPYAVGKDLKKGMNDGIPQEDMIIYTMENLKTREEKKLSSDEYINTNIWQDTLNWKIKNMHTEIIREAVLPSVHDFVIDCGNEDTTEEVLNEAKIAVITIPFAKKLSVIERAELRKIISDLAKKNIKFVVLTNEPEALSPIFSCFADQTTLKTINRSNPGLMILKKGVVVAKYHVNDFPAVKEIEKL